MAHMWFPVILCPNHEKAWHWAPGTDRNQPCWAAVLMALATRGQQVPTGSPAEAT